MNFLLLILGVALLYGGGEFLVRGAAKLGKMFGLSPLVVGLTIVSIGTSSPELAASLAAVLQGSPDVAIGNVVGSNIANLALVLGLTAMVWPLTPERSLLKREAPAMLATSALIFPMIGDGVISRAEGLFLCALLAVLLYVSVKGGQSDTEESRNSRTSGSIVIQLLLVVFGVFLLIGGANALVSGAVGIARTFDVSERVIGLTIVAFGTSLPELASSLVAALRRESDIVLGNLVGSNIFNVLFILGVTATVQPIAASADALRFDVWFMLGISALAWFLLSTGKQLQRWEGGVLCALYFGYIARLFW